MERPPGNIFLCADSRQIDNVAAEIVREDDVIRVHGGVDNEIASIDVHLSGLLGLQENIGLGEIEFQR